MPRRCICGMPSTAILFIGDVVGRAGRRVLRELLPGLREELAPTSWSSTARTPRAGSASRPRRPTSCSRAGRRRDHARQPHLPPPRDLAVPRGGAADRAPVQLPAHASRAAGRRSSSATASRSASSTSSGDRAPAGRPRRRWWRSTTRCARSRAPTTSSSTCTPRSTSEKVALGWYLDGKVTAVVGTHTHVPTADARVLPGGTAYITDVGMTGARGGVIGMKKEQSIAVMRTHMPMRYDAARRSTRGSTRC